MNEEKILNQALVMMEESGINAAYGFLIENKKRMNDASGQYYNFLYCLSALIGNEEEALAHLEEAIIDKGYWYRTAVFEDEDLDSIRNNERFIKCYNLSERRFEKAKRTVKTVNTWTKKKRNKIVIALHGNQQNNEDSKRNWGFLSNKGYQVEYIQSSEIDSYGIYRWEDDGSGPEQVVNELGKMAWSEYDEQILCGFSAGCNTILRSILSMDIQCTHIIFQSPWIPVIEERSMEIVRKIKEKNMKVTILCGLQDEDCLPLSKKLYEALLEENVSVNKEWIDGLSHEFPDDFNERIMKYLD